VIVTVTIPVSFWVIIHHISNSNSELFLLSILHLYNVFGCLYLVAFFTPFQGFFFLFLGLLVSYCEFI